MMMSINRQRALAIVLVIAFLAVFVAVVNMYEPQQDIQCPTTSEVR